MLQTWETSETVRKNLKAGHQDTGDPRPGSLLLKMRGYRSGDSKKERRLRNKIFATENSKNLKIGFFILFQTKGPQKRLKNCEIFQRTAKTEPDGLEQ